MTTSLYHLFQILLLFCSTKMSQELFFGNRLGDRRPIDGKILIHLEDDERLAYPKSSHPTVIRVHHTSPIIEDKFELSKINKKPPEYPNYGELKSTNFENLKSCCNFDINFKEVDLDKLEELFRPVSLPTVENYGITEGKSQDVKPVTEIIEDDLKYDFRTKMHSFR